MNTYTRFGNRWNINECLQLQREFELLQLPIDEIALRHQRTANAIMLKLHSEGFADYNELYVNYVNNIHLIPVDNYHHDEELHLKDEEEEDQDDSSDYSQEEDEDEELTLKDQVKQLSSQVTHLIELVNKTEQEKKKSAYSFF
jgi:hypothetical protein